MVLSICRFRHMVYTSPCSRRQGQAGGGGEEDPCRRIVNGLVIAVVLLVLACFTLLAPCAEGTLARHVCVEHPTQSGQAAHTPAPAADRTHHGVEANLRVQGSRSACTDHDNPEHTLRFGTCTNDEVSRDCGLPCFSQYIQAEGSLIGIAWCMQSQAKRMLIAHGHAKDTGKPIQAEQLIYFMFELM
eukprot:357281-Chlamydomonas_euryale.AAC.8